MNAFELKTTEQVFLLVTKYCRAEENVLKVIPVVDILNATAVHAVRGRRDEYKPIRSILLSSNNPREVAKVFENIGFRELYLADLDAITGGHPNFSLLKDIAEETDLELMVDAGVNELDVAEKLLDIGVHKVIIGTETLSNLDFVAKSIASFGSRNIVVSLDLMGKKIISGFELDGRREPISLLHEFQRLGVSQIVILDLARVGSGEGLNLPFLRDVLENIEAKIFVGGGVRDFEDLKRLRDLPVFGVLIASALHSGKISLTELKRAELI